MILKVPGPLPGRPLVIRERDGQLVPTPGRVVVYHDPVAILEPDRLDARRGVGQGRLGDRAPGRALVARGTQSDRPARPVLTHEGNNRTIILADQAGLDVAEA